MRGILATYVRNRATSEKFFSSARKLRSCRREFCTTVENDRSPLNGIRVLDLTRIVAGPYCTMILGDLGAEVLKVERPDGGDEARKWGPPFFQGTLESTYFMSVNRNKKSVCVDLKKGKDVIYELARTCDVLVENYVPGKLNSLGLGYEDVARVAPRLIYCSLTGYGSHGPYASRPGYDVIAASLGGLLHITGPKDGSPCKVGVAMTDLATGLYAHGAIMAALLQRSKTNRGQWIQCNLLSTQIACLINIASNYLNGNKEATRWGSEHESIVPYEAFPTKDGYMTIGVGSDPQFLELVKRLQMPELATDDKFKSNIARVKNRTELLKILRDTLKKKTNQEWSAILEGASFPYGAVNNIREDVPTVRLRLRKPKSNKKVQWTQTTVDNENLNRKKSKCCCIYEKPKTFAESSSEDSDDECEHCHGDKDAHKKALPKADDPAREGMSSHPGKLFIVNQNRLQQVQHKCIFMLIDNFSLNGKQIPLCYFSSQCVVQKMMMDRRYTNFNHDFALVHVFILQCFNSIAQITKCCSNC